MTAAAPAVPFIEIPATRWRAIWISDVHLGTRHAQVGELLQFLRQNESEFLYLVGDLIDGWELRRGWHWDDDCNTLIQKILRKNRKHTKVVYLTGNHDEFLESFVGLRFGGLRLAREVVHQTADGRRLLVCHGHQFDDLRMFNRLLERVGARLYGWILNCNHWFNRVRRRLGFGYWSLAAYLRSRAKTAVRYVTGYETAMARLAQAKGLDGIICGHIHRAEIRAIGALQYYNCGDWVESCTALVEDFEGNLSLIHFHEDSTDSPGRGPWSPHSSARTPLDAVPVGA